MRRLRIWACRVLLALSPLVVVAPFIIAKEGWTWDAVILAAIAYGVTEVIMAAVFVLVWGADV
ncbi:hypothetical protein LCGC14_0863870 [marine sediment metagenome]|uniref:Chlorhexidine efflux transporter domain-containing protein n=1 Tax=marine sediment metagenome TaxID=412755 RepID=A0A0F9SDN5_9ZZZZ